MGTTEINYYSVLGVSAKATPVEIKQKYRELSKKYHPDKNGGDSSRMMQLNEAYGVLSNPLKRKEYQPPGSKPKPTAATSNYKPAYAKYQRQQSPVQPRPQQVHEDPEKFWQVVMAYLLAIPLAILIISVLFPLAQKYLPKLEPPTPTTGQATTKEKPAPTQQTPATSSTPSPSSSGATPPDTPVSNTVPNNANPSPPAAETEEETDESPFFFPGFRGRNDN